MHGFNVQLSSILHVTGWGKMQIKVEIKAVDVILLN